MKNVFPLKNVGEEFFSFLISATREAFLTQTSHEGSQYSKMLSPPNHIASPLGYRKTVNQIVRKMDFFKF